MAGRLLTEELILNVDKVLCFAYDICIRILNAVLREDPTAPVATASHNLTIHRTLHTP